MKTRRHKSAPPETPKDFGPREFHARRNTILVLRPTGGAGDILMHRMMFEGLRSVHPDFSLHFACPAQYHDLVKGHPFVDEVVDSAAVSPREYVAAYDTGSACMRYERQHWPDPQKNRADIWAEHCGVTLTKHEGYLTIPEEDVRQGEETLRKTCGNRPSVLLCPTAAMEVRSIMPQHVRMLTAIARESGCEVVGCHTEVIKTLDAPTVTGLSVKEWMGLVAAADYVMTADTSHFHLAGLLSRPTLGVFAMTNGKVYGKYYRNQVIVQKHRDDGDWLCGPCYDWTRCHKGWSVPMPCMSLVTERMLREGWQRLLDGFPPPH